VAAKDSILTRAGQGGAGEMDSQGKPRYSGAYRLHLESMLKRPNDRVAARRWQGLRRTDKDAEK